MASAAIALFLSGCGPAILSADDAILRQGDEKVRLTAYVEQEPFLGLRRDVENAKVHFFAGGREVGENKTDRDGRASEKCRLPDDRVDAFEARVNYDGREHRRTARLFRWQRDRTIIVVDVDHTLADTKYEELILRPEDEESNPLKRSRRILSQLADDYQILYLTARPRFLLEKTRAWLDEEGYPPGPVMVAKGIRDAVHPGEFKRKALERLQDDWSGIRIGIGDNASDAFAYGANKMLTLVVSKTPDEGIGRHAIILRDWKSVGLFFEANREVLSAPERLKDIVEDRGMLLVPLYPWRK